MEDLTQPILVAVTGAGRNTEALRFAIGEARAIGSGVTLVHAVNPRLPPPPPSILITDDTWAEVGAHIVADVRHELETLLGDEEMTVTTLVHHGPPGRILSTLSRHARRVVLQHPDLTRLHRIATGSTIAGVATHAHCPVVSVPASGGHRPPTGIVTVGVHEDVGPPQVLEAAFAEASDRRSSLRLLHAWQMSDVYNDVLSQEAPWSDHSDALVTAAAADLRLKYPDVHATVEVRHEWPAHALVNASAASDLLVVGRHRGFPGLPARLGSITRTVLMHAPCPVMVVPLASGDGESPQ